MSANKSIITDLNLGEKLNEKNYDIWHRKVQYLLDDQDLLVAITDVVAEPKEKEDNTAYLALEEEGQGCSHCIVEHHVQ
jgi:Domain of unknown function (DUF4219)